MNELLKIVYSYQGIEYEAHRIPEFYRHLEIAARQIFQVNLGRSSMELPNFTFTYVTSSEQWEQHVEAVGARISDDRSLLEAISVAFQGPEYD